MKYINYSEELDKVVLPRFSDRFEMQEQIKAERNGFWNPNLTSKIVVTSTENLLNKTAQRLESNKHEINTYNSTPSEEIKTDLNI